MIIDTNVVVAADGGSPHAPSHCTIRCTETVARSRGEIVALDDGGLIVAEYLNNVRGGYPFGVGRQFALDVSNNQYNPTRFELVTITPHPDREYDEFPDDERLTKFDRSDRKFVAVALTSPNPHSIYNALDTDWAEHHDALVLNGVEIEYLCPSYTTPR